MIREQYQRICDYCGEPTVQDRRTIRVLEYGQYMYNPSRRIAQLCGGCWKGFDQALRVRAAERLEQRAAELRDGGVA